MSAWRTPQVATTSATIRLDPITALAIIAVTSLLQISRLALVRSLTMVFSLMLLPPLPPFDRLGMTQMWMNVQSALTTAVRYAATRWAVTCATVIQAMSYFPISRLVLVRNQYLLVMYLTVNTLHLLCMYMY